MRKQSALAVLSALAALRGHALADAPVQNTAPGHGPGCMDIAPEALTKGGV